jgi:hypothetical protein
MKIGDRVRVTGPDDNGFVDHIGTEFEITEAWRDDDVMKFSSTGVPWFPESSLERVVEEEVQKITLDEAAQMVSSAIAASMGDIIEFGLKQPTSKDDPDELNYDSLVSRIRALEKWQRKHDLEMPSRSSADSIEVGDWVKITSTPDKLIAKVSDVRFGCYINGRWYPTFDLRKLSDEEIARRLNR